MSDDVLYPLAVQFHILRHFTRIDDSYRKLLNRTSPYSDSEIDEQLEMPGSKFYSTFVSNPQELLNIIIQQKEKDANIRTMKQDERNIWIVRFYETAYPDGIGNNGLIPLKSLTKPERKRVRKGKREGRDFNLVWIDRDNPTWQLCVVTSTDDLPSVLTIFPGDYAPPLPDQEGMDKTQFDQSKRFWDNYALIVNE